MAKNAPVKKSKRRIKRSVRRSVAAVLMITAIGVAAVPVPENAAAPKDEPTAAAEVDSYKEETYGRDKNGAIKYDYESIASDNAAYSLEIYEENGQFGLYWQYLIDTSNQTVVRYNKEYPSWELTLNETVPTNYDYVLKKTYDDFVDTTEYEITSVNYYDVEDDVRKFFDKYFSNDKDYDKLKKAAIAGSKDENGQDITLTFKKGVYDLADVDRRTHYCDTHKMSGYILIPVRIQIPGDTDGQAALAQINKAYNETKAPDEAPSNIVGSNDVYIPRLIDLTNKGVNEDAKGYRLHSGTASMSSSQGIKKVGKYAFAGAGILKTIELPKWLTGLGVCAFMDCGNLQSVNIPFLSEIPDGAFKNCTELRTVNWWSDGATSQIGRIGIEAFYETGIIESSNGAGTVRFPNNLTQIDKGAFYGCDALTRIEFDSGSNAKIGEYAFYDNEKLNDVNFNNKEITELGDYCFAMGVYSNAMSTFTFPNSKFTTGKAILVNRTNLTQITVPEKVIKLKKDILEGCTGLQVVTFKGAGTSYEPELFNSVMQDDFYVTGPARNTPNATKDDVKDASEPRKSTWNAEKTAAGNYIPYLYKIGKKEYYEICSGEGYLESIDKATGTLTSCDLKDQTSGVVPNGELVIPDRVGNTDVVKIASDCFKGKDRLTGSVRSLVVGNNIRAIEDTVFKSWGSLRSVEIGKSIQTIGKEAFADCPNLTDITFATPDSYQTLTSVGANAFATKSGWLRIHGDIVDGYLPFEYAMNPNNYVESSNAVSTTKSRILYQSRWDSPSAKHLSVIYGEYDDGNGYATLVDYPLYQDFFSDSGVSADLEAHNRDMEKQFYNAYGNYAYPTKEDGYLEKKVKFAAAYETAKGDPASLKELYRDNDPDTGLYGPWINPSFCANYEQWAKYSLASVKNSGTVLDWLFEPMTVQAAGAPKPYFEYSDEEVNYAYDFLQNYSNAGGDRSKITCDYINGWTIDEQDMIGAADRIVIPAGVESIDLNGYYYAQKPNQQNVASNSDNYNLYFSYKTSSEYSRDGIFVNGVKDTGLFNSTGIDDLYNSADDREKVGNENIDQGDHKRGNDRIRVVDMSQSSLVHIPDYAFDDCELLEAVSIPASCATTGKLPFKDCVKLVTLTSSSEDVPALNGILYQKKEDAGYELVECLLTKGKVAGSSMISADSDDPYISQLSSIGESAFENCLGVISVDLSQSNMLKAIPNYCFRNCDALTSVKLPQSTQDVGLKAFANIREEYYHLDGLEPPRLVIEIRGTEFNFATTAFDPKREKDENGDVNSTIDLVTVWTYENTAAERYVLEQQRQGYDIRLGNEGPDHSNHQYLGTVKRVDFWDWNGDALCETIYLEPDDSRIFEDEVPVEVVAIVTAANHRPGYRFSGWRGDGGLKLGDPIPGDSITYVAQYESDGTMVNGKYIVEFFDGIDGHQLSGRFAADDGKYYIEPGTSFMSNGWPAPEWTNHEKEGYEFKEWSNGWTDNTRIDSTMRVIALYSALNSSGNSSNTSGNSSNTSNGSGNTGGSGTSNKNNSSTSATSTSSSSDSTSSTSSGSDSTGVKYTVTVENGSGSGSYEVGSTVVITANEPAPGMTFQKWTTESNGVTLASVSMTATTFTMPANNVTVTANYVAGAAATGNANNTGNTRDDGSTWVDITKPGISNKDLATANVNGSTDNFIVRISETDEATRAVQDALTNKYGSLDNILYYAMDISLYDSTGTYKITDTSGLSVDITIPIPDALVAYGGNNMAGAVINGNQLENLNENFTTINGVPCIRFTATHFSPYTVYVDTGNLTEGMLDTTPKTGDPIHPKWFLSIGLACLSVILFMKKDKAAKVKTV